MAPTFVVVPQWQGSVSPRAMRLVDGAEMIRGDLPSSATEIVDVPVEAGDAIETGIHRLSTILLVRERQATVLRGVGARGTGDWALTIGGDCGVSLAAVEYASRQHPNDLALVWFDARPRLHTAESSPSGGFGGMVLRAISGEGRPELLLDPASSVPLDRIVLAGARDMDDAEADLIAEHHVPTLSTTELDTPEALLAALRTIGATRVYLHVGLDVLDPAVLTGLADLVPFGLEVDALTRLITAVRGEFTLAGATIAGFAPATIDAGNDDMSSILRIIGALTR
ncbi:arginase family protein [Cryobacterium melibiosiphilum]|uniref:Arginase family protein n=1 Tax=Cryobacterium melibiosiphilum TaxID=995039 RepID=A0A3A5MK96_9MICO|nr:arginase family protein [Cryobacterium melibiosiphilum]RJT87498.1 arginase family protein [Cryobacterium melibiosiphilum]